MRIVASDDDGFNSVNDEDIVVSTEDIEVIEVRNFSDSTLELRGSEFSGVDEFVFTGNDYIQIGLDGDGAEVQEEFSTVTIRNMTDHDEVEIEVADFVFAGTDDELTVNLINAGDIDDSDEVDLYVEHDNNDDVIEIYNINSISNSGSGNYLDLHASDVTHTINVTGSTDLMLDEIEEDALMTINAGAFTGDLSFDQTLALENDFTYTGSQDMDDVDIDSGSGGNTGNTVAINTGTGDDNVEIDEQEDNIVNVDLGEGDDRLKLEDAGTVADTFQADDSYNGGAGMDRLVATNAALVAASAASAANVSNFEVLGVSDDFNINLDIDDVFSSINEVVLEDGFSAGATLSGLETGAILTSEASGVGFAMTVDMEGAVANPDDVLNLVLTNDSGTNFGGYFTSNIETVNIEADDAGDDADADHDADINGTGTETVVITGDAASLDLSNAPLTDVTMVDSTGFEGDLTISLAGNANDVTVNLGAGDDTVTSGDGADTFNGNGGEDTFVYEAASQSSGSNIDTILDFLSGEDKIDVSVFTGGVGQYLGEVNGTNAATSAFTGNVGDAVFDTSTNQLLVDEGDGTVGSGDLVIELTGVTELDAATDFAFA